jgi:hypothetical protein
VASAINRSSKRFGTGEVTGDNLDVTAQVAPRYSGPSRQHSDAPSVATKHVHNLQPCRPRTADYKNGLIVVHPCVRDVHLRSNAMS